MTARASNPRGSMWQRWDPHIHAPGTLLNDQFSGDWEGYLRALEESNPPVRAIGITDYLCLGTYREVRRWKAIGRLQGVELLYPNVELRLDLKTEQRRAINLHLLFSPDDPNHESEIERILAHLEFEFRQKRYRCTSVDLTALGRAFDSGQADERAAMQAGANQFKADLKQLREVFRTEVWLQRNCLVAVSVGADGTSGLKDDSFEALRQQIESFADIIFSSSARDREFWLGKKAGFDRSTIEAAFGALKPCLHGSDAHDVARTAAPDGQRLCWLKGDLTFETLRQAVIEPEERVWIGPSPPMQASASLVIDQVKTQKAPWLRTSEVPLNSGLVGVIGARGSGKTALLDIIARAAGAIGKNPGESSFLRRASRPVDLLGDSSVELTWGDGSSSGEIALRGFLDDEASSPSICYLSQQFVERLCSSAGLALELRHEIERVIFDATDPIQRLETDSFGELAAVLLEPVREHRREIERHIRAASDAIIREEGLRDRLSDLRREAVTFSSAMENGRKELETLLPKGREDRNRRLTELERACTSAEGRVDALRRRMKRLEDLRGDIAHVRDVSEPARLAELRRRYVDAGLSDEEWNAFRMTFPGSVDGVLAEAIRRVGVAIDEAGRGRKGSDGELKDAPLAAWPLERIRSERDAVKKDVGIDAAQQRKYDEIQKALSTQQNSLRRCETEIKEAEGADGRRKILIDERRANYARVFDAVVKEEEALKELYAPLHERLQESSGSLQKMDFVVRRQINLDAWCGAGEELLDLRNATSFRGHGAIRAATEKVLLPAWQRGAALQVESAMDSFRGEYTEELLRARPASLSQEEIRIWKQQLAGWLFSTEHVSVEYDVRYEGVAIEQLSPGTRGIVLLLLYLAIDHQDLRPLVIDQPEENLDPNSVFAELVPHFRSVRKRRQVIVVTHNANLVVNTDADQVIVAGAATRPGGGLPDITYHSGSLEDPEIRRLVCEILEGGERAFLEREKRYRLRPDDGHRSGR